MKKSIRNISLIAAAVVVLGAVYFLGGTPAPQGADGSSSQTQGEVSAPEDLEQPIQAPEDSEQPVQAPEDPTQPVQTPEDPEQPIQAPETTEEPGGASSQQAACTFSIRCDTILDNLDQLDPAKGELVPADGVLLAETQVPLEEGDTPFSLLQELTRANGIHLEFSFTPGTGSAYVEGISNLYQFDCGPLSGWLFLVNGASPSVSCSDYVLSDGDVVEWAFTCDMGTDLGLDFSGEGAA